MAKNSVSPAFDKYQAEDDHRTLGRAEEIRGDSKRMKGVKVHHRMAKKVLAGVGKALGGGRR